MSNIITRDVGLSLVFANRGAQRVVLAEDVHHRLAVLVLYPMHYSRYHTSQCQSTRLLYRILIDHVRGIRASLKQALEDMQPQLAVLNGDREVQRCGAAHRVDGIHVTLLVREDVLEHVGRAVDDAVLFPRWHKSADEQ